MIAKGETASNWRHFFFCVLIKITDTYHQTKNPPLIDTDLISHLIDFFGLILECLLYFARTYFIKNTE